MKKRRSLAAFGLVATLTAAAGGVSAATDAPPGTDAPTGTDATPATGSTDQAALDELIAAAQEEGSLMLYTEMLPNVTDPVLAAFEEKYGIETEYLRLSSGELAQRFASEADAGQHVADVFLGSQGQFITDQIAAGNLVPLVDADLPSSFPPAGYPEQFVADDLSTAVVQVNPFGFIYNTDLVEEPPTDWPDLIDPQYENEIVLFAPGITSSLDAVYDYLQVTYGDQFLIDLGNNARQSLEGVVPQAQAVAAGEGMIGAPNVESVVAGLAAEGAPIAYVQPSGTVGGEPRAGLVAEAPHPAVARLFIEFILSEEGNLIMGAEVGPASVYDEGGDLPSGYTSPRPEASDPERSAELVALLEG